MKKFRSNLSCFYIPELELTTIQLSEEESKHAIKALRLKIGDYVLLTNGQGTLAQAQIVDNHIKHTVLQIEEMEIVPPNENRLHIALSILQHADRFEWFVEKAVELGIAEITPILCTRTEKKHINTERIKKIAISALKQSRQAYLPKINEAETFTHFIQNCGSINKAIAMCEGNRIVLSQWMQTINKNELTVVIGPEGDFTEQEAEFALTHGFVPIQLGNSILRSETAAVYVAAVSRFLF
ncbi:MAG: 16S rRNA (uracil(1498)-N(3))-methyltransferase [Bacteroidales bacterium]|nr:16S rRNA (uracil(1498)-N(3))-methyltransferase [Bacteroidales bacterium]